MTQYTDGTVAFYRDSRNNRRYVRMGLPRKIIEDGLFHQGQRITIIKQSPSQWKLEANGADTANSKIGIYRPKKGVHLVQSSDEKLFDHFPKLFNSSPLSLMRSDDALIATFNQENLKFVTTEIEIAENSVVENLLNEEVLEEEETEKDLSVEKYHYNSVVFFKNSLLKISYTSQEYPYKRFITYSRELHSGIGWASGTYTKDKTISRAIDSKMKEVFLHRAVVYEDTKNPTEYLTELSNYSLPALYLKDLSVQYGLPWHEYTEDISWKPK